MKRVILALVIVAVAALVAVKLMNRSKQETQPQAAQVATSAPSNNQTNAQSKPVFFLFHEPSDQDAGCRRIYAFADRAERELAGRVEVRRPDVERERNLVEQYQVRV